MDDNTENNLSKAIKRNCKLKELQKHLQIKFYMPGLPTLLFKIDVNQLRNGLFHECFQSHMTP